MARKVQLQTNGKEWQVIDGEQVLVDVPKQDIDPITSSSCVQIEGFRTLEEAVSDNKMLSQDLTYTKVMDKVGGDYHQNVLDGQYSKAILYGNTQVNLCEEDSSVALQIPTTFTSFNNGELQINNKENQVVAPLIKGVTMVNLAQTDSSSITSDNGLPIHNVKGNTLYTLSFKFTTKNTNSGVVIQSYDANGTYLENTMHKTGLGDVVKFTFTTHANATKIHICNNAAYGGETIQLDEIMLIEGDQTALDIPFFKGMKSVELVRPLTNLFTDDLTMYAHNTTVTNSGGTVTVTSTTVSQWASAIYYLDLKPNTKYVIMWDGLTFTQTANGIDYIISVCENDTIFSHMGNKFTTLRSIIFDTGDKSAINIRIHATMSNTETGITTVTGLRVFEYDDYLRSIDLQSIGWFSGTKNVAVEPVKTCSKNLYPYGDINFTPTGASLWCDATGKSGMYDDIAQKSKCRFLLKKGTYCISHGETANVQPNTINLVSDKETFIAGCEGGNPTPFTLTEDTYCTLRVKTIEANVATTLTNIQIERGETATDYVAHDSRYYEPNGQNAIILRSLPSGVCDTFNLQTGEYVQRIGEVILDGSQKDEYWLYNETNQTFRIQVLDAVQVAESLGDPTRSKILVLSDKLTSRAYNEDWNSGTFISLAMVRRIVLRIEGIATVSELTTYLKQNPITVQYQLATPITTIIPRTIKCNNNGTVSAVDFKTYTNKENLRLPKNPSYLTINSMTSIKPIVEPITYFDFKTRLKTNTDYTIKLNKETNAFVTTNLGGTSVVFNTGDTQKFVRTPSIDLEQNLRISGSGSIQNIMVIEGDVLDKELPYFNGMCNVKMPIVRNCGKNLFNFDEHKSNWWFQGGQDEVIKGDDTGIPYSALIPISPLYYYKIQSDNWDRRFLVFLDANFDTISWEANVNITSLAPLNARYLLCYLNSKGISKEDNIMITASKDKNSNTISYEPYKGNDICLVQGEIGLSQDMFEQGGFSGDSGNTYDNCKANTNTNIRMRTKGLITVKPNTTYIVNNNTSPNVNHVFYLFDESQKYLGSNIAVNAKSFVTPNNCGYVSLMFSKNNNANISVSEFKQELFQLLELDSTVQLRSLPNGVKDELNLLTGEYIQRVGEIVLDGSEGIVWGVVSDGGKLIKTICFTVHEYIEGAITNSAICSHFQQIYSRHDIEHFYNENLNGKALVFFINRDKLTTLDHNGFNQWLSQNPLTIQYELAEPIISYPRIVSNTQEREVGVKLPNGICDTYNPSTGITVKRVGKVVLDGSENWLIDAGYTPTANLIRLSIKHPDKKLQYNNGDLVCDKLPVVQQGVVPCIYDRWNEFLYVDVTSSNIGVTFGTDDNATIISKFKTWLNANPLTVYYELKHPIITTDIVLPNGVHDEYNPLTGLYTKRVGYVEFDGSNDERWHEPFVVAAKGAVDMYGTWTEQPLNNAKLAPTTDERIPGICDKLKFRNSSLDSANEEFYFISYTGRFNMNINRSKLSEPSEQSLKTYLSQNPIKVWYELSTPITYQLTPYFGLPMPYAYKDGYLIMDSAYDGQTLPPEITYQLTVNRTGQITQNNIKLKEHTARLSNLEYILIEATLDSIFDREMQNFELELMNIELFNLDE